MKCRALRGFYLQGVAIKKGDPVEVPDHLVRQLELTGKIERLPEASPKKPAKAGPLTAAANPALVPGAQPKGPDHVASGA